MYRERIYSLKVFYKSLQEFAAYPLLTIFTKPPLDRARISHLGTGSSIVTHHYRARDLAVGRGNVTGVTLLVGAGDEVLGEVGEPVNQVLDGGALGKRLVGDDARGGGRSGGELHGQNAGGESGGELGSEAAGGSSGSGGGGRGGRSDDGGGQGGGLNSGGGDGSGGGGGRGDGSARARGGRARGAGAGATDSEVDARLVGLVDAAGVPPPLDDTLTSGGALTAEVLGDGDVEGSVGGLDTGGSGGILVPVLQDRANDAVGGSLDDGDVGGTGVGSADVDLEGHGLAELEGLDVVLVVVELVALAEPDVALGGVVVALGAGDLELALDVAVVVGLLVVVDLLTASGSHGITRHTGRRAGDEAVASNNAGQDGEGGNVLGRHFDLVGGESGFDWVQREETVGVLVPVPEERMKDVEKNVMVTDREESKFKQRMASLGGERRVGSWATGSYK